jgi:hypothetical protein
MRPAPPAQIRAPWRCDCARAGQVAAILFSGFCESNTQSIYFKTNGKSVERIAREVGYSDAVTLRILLRRRLERSTSQLRRLQD